MGKFKEANKQIFGEVFCLLEKASRKDIVRFLRSLFIMLVALGWVLVFTKFMMDLAVSMRGWADIATVTTTIIINIVVIVYAVVLLFKLDELDKQEDNASE